MNNHTPCDTPTIAPHRIRRYVGVMIAELGHYLLILALFTSLAQGVLPMVGAQKNSTNLMAFGDRAAILSFALLALSFAALTATFIASDFSVKLAASHSHSMKPFL